MHVNYKSALAAFTLVAAGMLYICAANGEPSYSRQDCIQKVVFDWGDRNPKEVEKVIDAIADALRQEWEEEAYPRLQVPDYTFPFAHRNEWYLQYRQACEQKKARTAHLIEKALVPSVPGLPSYTITDERVVPSPRTIDLTGEYWEKDEFH